MGIVSIAIFIFALLWISDADLDFGGGVVHLHTQDYLDRLQPEPAFNFVNFYAPWCGHCTTFAPTWGLIARSITYSCGNISFFAVNCVKQRGFCNDRDISAFPVLGLLSADGVVLDSKLGGLSESYALNWVTSRTPHCSRADIPNTNGGLLVSKSTVPLNRLSRQDLAATIYYLPQTLPPLDAQQFANLTTWFHLLRDVLGEGDLKSWDILIDYLEATLNEPLADEWPIAFEIPEAFHVWGFDSSVEFDVCEGEYHGYPCGLWQLLHLVMQAATDESALTHAVALRDFVQQFFNCEECREHFVEEAGELTNATIGSRRDGVLWIWGIHNSASERIAPQWGTDPEVVFWPTADECRRCRSDDDSAWPPEWDEDQVYEFHARIYTLAPRFPVEIVIIVSLVGLVLLIASIWCWKRPGCEYCSRLKDSNSDLQTGLLN